MSTCLNLVGGGSRGIFGGGSLTAIRDKGVKFDALVTSSVGTLNGLFIFQDKYDEMKDLWMNINTAMVYKRHWLKGLGFVSLYDPSPLRKLLKSHIDLKKIRANTQQKFYISTSSFTRGEAMVYEINELADDEILEVLVASASPPAFFPPVNFKGQELVDAGVTNNFGLATAVNLGYDDLIVIKYPPGRLKPVKSKLDALTNTITAAMDSDYSREKSSIKKINSIIDQCHNTDLKHIKVTEICTQNCELDYDFLDFDFKGKCRAAIWQSGYNRAVEVLGG